jgi:L-ascorbate metabolism protein UlaG (beta-lactamase superfamily)
MKLWKKVLIAVFLLLLCLGGAVLWFGWSLSADISGVRLQRVQASAHYGDDSFVNIEPEAAMEVTWAVVKEQFFGTQQREPLGQIPVVLLPPEQLESRPAPGLRSIWLGHATVLIEIDGYRVLTDPNLSQRASPFQFAGPKRLHPPPIELSQLSGIDAVVLSHNHYDHLDEASIRHLATQGTNFYVPLGNGTHLEAWGIPLSQIHELDWWQEAKLGSLSIVATPARHYSGRGLFDFQATLWASWTLVGPRHRLFYSGDTGYSKVFRDIGKRYGPFDLTIIKVGAYGPGANWHDIHMPPEESVQVHMDVGGKRMLPVHWATFNLAMHDWDEPIKRTINAADGKPFQLLTPRIGETVTAGQPFENSRWWDNVK